MAVNNQCRDVGRLKIQLVTTILKLVKLDVPIFTLWYTENEVHKYGTKHLMDLVGNIDKISIDTAVKQDVLNMTSPEPDEPLLTDDENVPEIIRAKQFFQKFSTNKEPDLLPFPLTCMNKKEKISWITKQILQEQREKSTKKLNFVKYGDSELRPSFWLNEEWEWTMVATNLSNITNKIYTGPGHFQDFLTRTIDKCLRMNGKDPELFVVKTLDVNMVKKKKKNKEIHDDAHIVTNESFEDGNDESNYDRPEDDERDAEESTYRLPVSSSSSQQSFIPRRRLPDSLPPRFPGLDPAPPAANHIPQSLDPSPPSASVYNMDNGLNLPNLSQIVQPILSNEDFELCRNSRTIINPPVFLAKICHPLHTGWKLLENTGGGPCLFRAGADHIYLRDFRILRRFVHAHIIIEQWYFYCSFYIFPLSITIGSGDHSHQKTILDEQEYHDFLNTEESMMAFNTSQAEIAALGTVLNVDIFVLTYNIQNRDGTQEERTQWNEFPLNHGLACESVFCTNTQEPLRILHEDEVHFTKLVWMPLSVSADHSRNESTTPASRNGASTPTGDSISSASPRCNESSANIGICTVEDIRMPNRPYLLNDLRGLHAVQFSLSQPI